MMAQKIVIMIVSFILIKYSLSMNETPHIVSRHTV